MHRRGLALIAATALGLAATGVASAADIPARGPVYKAAPAPAFSWSGFYVGAFVGGLWGNKHWLEIVGPVPGGFIEPEYSGVIGGGQVGFNHQISNWVFGIEGDWGWTNAKGSTRCIATAAFTCGVELHWVATLTGRIGYAFDRTLIYAKGGAVWVREDYPVAPGSAFALTLHHTRDGWTAGGGVEYAFAPSWSAKLEYNYYDLGTDRLDFAGAIEDITQTAHVVKAGLNYRFGWR
jgi:outer membrane immunogenic protein